MGLGLFAPSAAADRWGRGETTPFARHRSFGPVGFLESSRRPDGAAADYRAGEKAYREAIRIESAHPNDRQNREKLANSLYGLGTLLAKQGRYVDAEENLRETLERQKALYGEPIPVARTLKDLSPSHRRPGDLNARSR